MLKKSNGGNAMKEKKESLAMNETTTNANAALLSVTEFDGHAQYNQAIDDACVALDAIGDANGWATVRALREPKIPIEPAEPANVAIPPGPRPVCPKCHRDNLLLWPAGHPQQVSCCDCHRTFTREVVADFLQFFFPVAAPSVPTPKYSKASEMDADDYDAEFHKQERIAQLIAHRACTGSEHDPTNGKLHGYCVVCGVPWPCSYAALSAPSAPVPSNKLLESCWTAVSKLESQVARNKDLPSVYAQIVPEAFDALRQIEKLLAPSAPAQIEALPMVDQSDRAWPCPECAKRNNPACLHKYHTESSLGMEQVACRFWMEWAEKKGIATAEGWLELTPKQAREFADRHYSRQKPGTPQFVPPGRCFVLVGSNNNAVWITSWPFAEYVKHAWPGAWICSAFRRESGPLASLLIMEAVAATRWYFGRPPANGMVTFIDPDEVLEKKNYGQCFRAAGFVEAEPPFTKGGLVALQMWPRQMPRKREPGQFLGPLFAQENELARRGTE
jgi:hypothetical protein